MKMWKRYLVSALAVIMVAAMSLYLPRIYGETAAEETSAATEPVETGLLETEPPETLDNAGGAIDETMNPPKLTLVPRELTDEEKGERVTLKLEQCERQCILTNAEGEMLQICDCAVSGDMEYTDMLFTVGPPLMWRYLLPPSSLYSFVGHVGSERTKIAWDGDCYADVMGTGIETILITRDGISIQGRNMNFKMCRNEEGSDHMTVLRTENASRAVLKYEDGQFLLWSDGAYSIEVYDNWSGATLLGKEVEADSVFCVQEVSSDAPTCHRVDTTE